MRWLVVLFAAVAAGAVAGARLASSWGREVGEVERVLAPRAVPGDAS